MSSLKRSFFYTLLIFFGLLLAIFLLTSVKPSEPRSERTRVNPAQFISQTEQRIDKQKGSLKQTQSQDQQQNPTQPAKKVTQSLPTIEKNKELNLPSSQDKLLESLVEALPEAVEADPVLSPQESMLKEVYGDDITRLSTTAKKYLMTNHLKMQVITQRVLNRIGRVYIDSRMHYYAHNYVEFILFPDGHISDIKILKDAGFQLLDKITKETIETAFKDYELPKEPILVRYKFLYDLRGY